MLRFLWIASRGFRLRPWESPYLRWRIETFSGVAAESITARTFFRFLSTEKSAFWRYLTWVSRMRRAR
jgi:hypothetical protein